MLKLQFFLRILRAEILIDIHMRNKQMEKEKEQIEIAKKSSMKNKKFKNF